MQKENVKYEKRILAYIDILGFKNLIDLTITKSGRDYTKFIKVILDAYKSFKRVWNDDLSYQKAYRKNSSRLITYFSDCIVISFQVKDEIEVYHTVLSIREMLMSLVKFGIICRGAITIGKVVHRPSLIFGPALVDAYLKETQNAIYPRIILSEQVSQIALKYPRRILGYTGYPIGKDVVFQDFDGNFYIDYFYMYADDTEYPDIDTFYFLRNLRATIVDGLQLSQVDKYKKIYPKYKWMQDKFNEALKFYQSEDHIEFLLKIEDTDYKIVRKIMNIKAIQEMQT